jgi:transcription antitermination factor NusG
MQGNLRQVYEALCDRWEIGQIIGRGAVDPLMAEIVVGLSPGWYVLQVLPAHEGIAASHLIGRRFGVYVPELVQRRRRRGQSLVIHTPMFPGYLFVFAWLNASNYRRIRDVPGVGNFLCVGLEPAIIADGIVDTVRAVENKRRPLVMAQEEFGTFKRVKRHWRRYRKVSECMVDDHDIVAVRTWSALRDGLNNALDGDERNRLLLDAVGLAA